MREVRGVHFLDSFGPTEALWELEVADFPCLVTMDTHGNSLHETVVACSSAVLYKALGLTRMAQR